MARALRSVKTFKKSWDADKALKSTYQGKFGLYQLRGYIFLALGYAVVVAWLTRMPTFARKTPRSGGFISRVLCSTNAEGVQLHAHLSADERHGAAVEWLAYSRATRADRWAHQASGSEVQPRSDLWQNGFDGSKRTGAMASDGCASDWPSSSMLTAIR